MHKAYGATVILLVNSQLDSERYSQWKWLVQYVGNHYVLLGGATERRYVYLLTEEVSHLAAGSL